jgi:16S rRNA processing protein RimM
MPPSRPNTPPVPAEGITREPSTAEPRVGFIAIGRVLGTWGLQGALKIESLTDFPERYARGASLWLAGKQRRVSHVHAHRGALIVKVSGIDDPDTAQKLRGALIELPESELHALEEDEYYEHDLIGLAVRTDAGEELGRVDALLPTGANPVLVVHGERGEYLLPFIEEVVHEVDMAARRVKVELLPGLEPTPKAAQKPKREARSKTGEKTAPDPPC